MKSNGHNGRNERSGKGATWLPEGVEVTDNPFLSTRAEQDAAEAAGFDAQEAEQTMEEPTAAPPQQHRRKRKALFLFVTALALLCAGLGFYALYGGKKQVAYRITEKQSRRAGQTGQATPNPTGLEPETTDQTTAEAISQAKAELRKAGAAPEAPPTPVVAPAAITQPESQTQTAHTPIFTPYIVPDEPVNETAKRIGGSGAANSTGQTGAPSGANNVAEQNHSTRQSSRSNTPPAARSIYVVEPERTNRFNSAPPPPVPSVTPTYTAGNAPTALAAITLPGFGSMLPVRTLGAVYTLRNGSLVRLETTRDVTGEGWTIKRGTLLVAQAQGGELDRAFLNLLGFIDPATGRFVRVAGDVLGADGAPGLKGKRRRVDGRWSRVFSRAASGALLLGQAALARGSATIVMPGSFSGLGNDFGLSANTLARREFVEVPASTGGYVLITNLPKEARGADATPPDENEPLADEEMAVLLTNGAPEQIREALPRMSPELRRLARLALGEKLP